uniref:ribosome modulation factor n=1 Tax=Sphingomonas bacterium TaxID=1895847 RepID=UPI00345B59FA
MPLRSARATAEGGRSAARGEPLTACPYSAGLVMVAWQEGWRAATAAKTAKT